jgi:hypothetical protein
MATKLGVLVCAKGRLNIKKCSNPQIALRSPERREREQSILTRHARSHQHPNQRIAGLLCLGMQSWRPRPSGTAFPSCSQLPGICSSTTWDGFVKSTWSVDLGREMPMRATFISAGRDPGPPDFGRKYASDPCRLRGIWYVVLDEIPSTSRHVH